MSISEKNDLWKKRISEYRASNLIARVWCEKNNVSITSMRYWITKFNKESDQRETQWVSVKESPELIDSSPNTSLITINTGSYSIGIPDGFQQETLIRILRVLGTYA